jgi:adenosine kinase
MSFSGRYRDHINPEKLDSLSISIFLEQLKDAHGGVGANIAYSLALMGDEPYLVGSVGPDATAYMEKLAHDGVNITHVYTSQLPTAAFNVITDSDQNQVGGFYPGAMFDSDALTFATWKDSKAIIVVSPHDPKAMKRQVAECKQWGLRLMYDVGQQVSNLGGEDMAAGVRAAEILILNEYELSVLAKKTGFSVEKIKDTVPVVVTTLGKEGSVIEGKNVLKAIKVGVAKPLQVADPTGAGDAYRSGFLYGLVRSWPYRDCARMGAVTASYAIEALGTQNHSFTLDDVKVRYKNAFGEQPPDM